MTTYIVVPRQRPGSLIQALDDNDLNGASKAMLDQVRAMLAGTSFAARPLLTDTGLIQPDGSALPAGPDTSLKARDEAAPRLLSALDIILLDDPPPDVLRKLAFDADLFENVEIPIVEPVEEIEQPCDPWHLKHIKIQKARDKKLTGAGVRIAVADTGIDASHPEFAGKHIDFAEFDAQGFLISIRPRDAGDHGTHVCGLAAGKTCGVAPEADLAVAAVLTQTNNLGSKFGSLAQILGGLNWLAHSNHPSPKNSIQHCPVINASFGVTPYQSWLLSSVQTIRSTPASLLVAAIGNNGRSGVNHHGSPGNYDNVAGIGATDKSDNPAPFSDWGVEANSGALKPDLSAPGVDICSALPGNRYGLKSGTSMAAPQVAGAAALLIQQNTSFARNPAGLFTRLLRLVDTAPAARSSATVSHYNRIGAGRLDLGGI